MWHVRPQHFPTDSLCQPLQFVPHSSSSIQLIPFLSLPSFSIMLFLLCPFCVAVLESRLMQSLFCYFLMMWLMNFHVLLRMSPLRFPISTIWRTSLFVILYCQHFLYSSPVHFDWIVALQMYSQQFTFVHLNFPSHPFGLMCQLIGLGLNVLLGWW